MRAEQDSAANTGAINQSYGLGWFLGHSPSGLPMVWHEGGWTGASAMLKLVSSKDVAVAVLMNGFDGEFINQVTEETLRAVLPDYGTMEPRLPAFVHRAPGQFLGSIPGTIGDADFERYSEVLLDLRLVGDELKGTASATTRPDNPRMHFHLPYAVSMRRAPASPEPSYAIGSILPARNES